MTDIWVPEIWAPAAAFFIAAASPGPATLAVAGAAMSSGMRPALWLSMGLAISLAAWGGLVALGLGPLVLASSSARWVLRIGGGLFLLYLAWGSFRSALAPKVDEMPTISATSSVRMILRGLVLNGLNPKAGLAWAAVIALGGASDTAAVWLVVGICAAMGLLIYVAYAVMFAAPPVRLAYAKARTQVDGFVALGFVAAGAALLLRRGDV